MFQINIRLGNKCSSQHYQSWTFILQFHRFTEKLHLGYFFLCVTSHFSGSELICRDYQMSNANVKWIHAVQNSLLEILS